MMTDLPDMKRVIQTLLLTGLASWCAAAGSPAAVADPDEELIVSLNARATRVMRRHQDAAALARPLYPPLPVVTNATAVVLPAEPPVPATNLPAPFVAVVPAAPVVTNVPPPVFVLKGIFSSAARRPAAGGRTLALLNGRLVSAGDAVEGNMRVSRIEADHVVLVDTQGVRCVVRFYER
jgi:hypothetical protein